MTGRPAAYPTQPSFRSSLIKNPPEPVPPTDELDALYLELRNHKQRVAERAKKASDDLRTIEDSWRRMQDKKKGKAKADDKIKKETEFASIPDVELPRLAGPSQVSTPRPRFPSSTPIPSTSSVPPASRKAAADSNKKKKNAKRKFQPDSDDEHAPSVPPAPHSTPHAATNRAPRAPPASHARQQPNSSSDFVVPPAITIPKRPPVPPPPIPGPSKPTEVTEDFSKCKPPAQILVSTFYSSIEPWLRPIKEEDIGFLEYTADEVEPYVMPKLGRHYSEIWEKEDIAYYGMPLMEARPPSNHPPNAASTSGPPLPKWDPSTLSESDALKEERGHGPLTERLVSALLPIPDLTGWKGVKAAEDAMEGRPGITGAAFAAARERISVGDLEDRIVDTMRFHGMLPDKLEYSDAVDDPISAALRQAQRELRTVVATNKARKARLAERARDRLGYQEYLDLRDSIDRHILSTYTRLQKKDGPKASKKKKLKAEAAAAANGGAINGGTNGPGLPPCPASLGLAPDEENQLNVPEQLNSLVATRRQWVDAVGGVFEEKEKECEGRVWGLPRECVFLGIEEDVRLELERMGRPGSSGPGSGSAHVGFSSKAAGPSKARRREGQVEGEG